MARRLRSLCTPLYSWLTSSAVFPFLSIATLWNFPITKNIVEFLQVIEELISGTGNSRFEHNTAPGTREE